MAPGGQRLLDDPSKFAGVVECDNRQKTRIDFKLAFNFITCGDSLPFGKINNRDHDGFRISAMLSINHRLRHPL